MPPGTTIKKFVDALKTRKTVINSALDQLFTESRRHEAYLAELSNPDALNSPVPDWAKAELRKVGLGDVEFAHMNRWPDTHKEAMRKAIVTAIQTNRHVRFFWELHAGPDNVTDVQDQGTGDITVTFRSPLSKVKVSMATFGEITVDV